MIMFFPSWFLPQVNLCCFELNRDIKRGEVVTRLGGIINIILMFMFLIIWFLPQINLCCFDLAGCIKPREVVMPHGRYNKIFFEDYFFTVMVYNIENNMLTVR